MVRRLCGPFLQARGRRTVRSLPVLAYNSRVLRTACEPDAGRRVRAAPPRAEVAIAERLDLLRPLAAGLLAADGTVRVGVYRASGLKEINNNSTRPTATHTVHARDATRRDYGSLEFGLPPRCASRAAGSAALSSARRSASWPRRRCRMRRTWSSSRGRTCLRELVGK